MIRSKVFAASILLVAAAFTGCSRKRSAPPPDLAPRVVIYDSPCEVEIEGYVRVPKEHAGAPAPMTFVAAGDCLAEQPKIVGYGGSTAGRFFVEVFVKCGSELTLCAASEPAPGAPSRLYGKAARVMRAEHAGAENEFKGLTVDLTPGAPRTFPRP